MADFPNPIDAIVTIVRLVGETSVSALLSSVGLLLIMTAIAIAVIVVRNPGTVPRSHTVALFVTLVAGITFSAAGPSYALYNVTKNVIPKITIEKALENLGENSEISWLVRLIPFDPATQSNLSIGHVPTLGHQDQKFSFVAPYEDLRGRSAAEALQKVGATRRARQHVSAVIFPIPSGEIIYPANARGVLQVVREVENSLPDGGKFLVRNSGVLSDEDKEDLGKINTWTWRFDNYKDRYVKYCKLTHAFRCNPSFSARKFIGDLQHDWHPMGLSQTVRSDPCNEPAEQACSTNNWDSLKRSVRSSFGSRIFLIRNLAVRDLAGRIMVDFTNPEYQYVPDIGLREGISRTAE